MDDDIIDYFAGCALTGLIMSDGWENDMELAYRAYEIAETMIQVREIMKRGTYE